MAKKDFLFTLLASQGEPNNFENTDSGSTQPEQAIPSLNSRPLPRSTQSGSPSRKGATDELYFSKEELELVKLPAESLNAVDESLDKDSSKLSSLGGGSIKGSENAEGQVQEEKEKSPFTKAEQRAFALLDIISGKLDDELKLKNLSAQFDLNRLKERLVETYKEAKVSGENAREVTTAALLPKPLEFIVHDRNGLNRKPFVSHFSQCLTSGYLLLSFLMFPSIFEQSSEDTANSEELTTSEKEQQYLNSSIETLHEVVEISVQLNNQIQAWLSKHHGQLINKAFLRNQRMYEQQGKKEHEIRRYYILFYHYIAFEVFCLFVQRGGTVSKIDATIKGILVRDMCWQGISLRTEVVNPVMTGKTLTWRQYCKVMSLMIYQYCRLNGIAGYLSSKLCGSWEPGNQDLQAILSHDLYSKSPVMTFPTLQGGLNEHKRNSYKNQGNKNS